MHNSAFWDALLFVVPNVAFLIFSCCWKVEVGWIGLDGRVYMMLG